MKSVIQTALIMIMLGSATIVVQACATGTSAVVKPTGPVDLDKTQWRLVALGGSLDGRIVEFKRRGDDGYSGTLVDLGRRLRDVVGIKPGMQIFTLKRRAENEYEGIYKAIQTNGNYADKEIVVFIKDNTMTWDQESAIWERIK